MKTYEIRVRRFVTEEAVFTVVAENEKRAKREARRVLREAELLQVEAVERVTYCNPVPAPGRITQVEER